MPRVTVSCVPRVSQREGSLQYPCIWTKALVESVNALDAHIY